MSSKKEGGVSLACFSQGSSRKKGAAHIEMIAAFLLFFTFVVFMLLILKPYEAESLSGAVVSGLYDNFEEKTLTNLTNVFIMANLTPIGTATCVNVSLPGNIFSYGFTDSIVTNLADQNIPSNLEEVAGIGNLNLGDPAAVYYKVAISPDFNGSGLSSCVSPSTYVVGSILERQVISYNKLKEIQGSYYNDSYEDLKGQFGVPEVYDFAILIEGIGEGKYMQGVVPEEGDILANDYISEVLFPNGTVVNARITFKVW